MKDSKSKGSTLMDKKQAPVSEAGATEKKRESFKSSLGFILVSAGCAIGIGNVWKFPYLAGENGGGVFVLFYLIFLLLMGVPILTMEFAVGRASRKSPIGCFKSLEKPGHKWHFHGIACIVGCYLLMMYYSVVSGWMLDYFVKFLTGGFEGVSDTATEAVFDTLLGSPVEMIVFMAVIVVLGFLVCSFGLQNGLERITKVMMVGLLVLILVLVVNSLLLPNAAEGVIYYLVPDFAGAWDMGLHNVIAAAMNQAFFTLSIGIGSMEIFGSYMSKENTLATESIRICGLDTFVALMAGLIILPACASFGVDYGEGPSLIFVTLPKVFINMAGGRIFGSLFFLFMTFACFTTIIAVFQNLVAACEEAFGWSKRKTALLNCLFVLVGSLPAIFSYNIWSGVSIFGKSIFDLEDFIVSNLLLPIGALVYLLFCVYKLGWGEENYLLECNTGKGLKMSKRLLPYFRYVLPVLILIILVFGLIP